jgi:hypothetical protein
MPATTEVKPHITFHALDRYVLATATPWGPHGAWCAYIAAVEGESHVFEMYDVLNRGTKLREPFARALFPDFDRLPYVD